jgi:predicted O-methyltransferase YrrM
MTDGLYEFLVKHSTNETEVQLALREETAKHPRSNFQIAPEQGQFMALLAKLVNAKKALEVGVFTGYSALCVAQAMPADGKLIACDIDVETGAIARRHWQLAGVSDKIELIIAPAEQTLAALAELEPGSFDFVFVDANKLANELYYEHALVLLRAGGLVAVDNVFCGGRVVEPTEKIARTTAAFCAKVNADERVDSAIVPIADGLLLARKR